MFLIVVVAIVAIVLTVATIMLITSSRNKGVPSSQVENPEGGHPPMKEKLDEGRPPLDFGFSRFMDTGRYYTVEYRKKGSLSWTTLVKVTECLGDPRTDKWLFSRDAIEKFIINPDRIYDCLAQNEEELKRIARNKENDLLRKDREEQELREFQRKHHQSGTPQ